MKHSSKIIIYDSTIDKRNGNTKIWNFRRCARDCACICDGEVVSQKTSIWNENLVLVPLLSFSAWISWHAWKESNEMQYGEMEAARSKWAGIHTTRIVSPRTAGPQKKTPIFSNESIETVGKQTSRYRTWSWANLFTGMLGRNLSEKFLKIGPAPEISASSCKMFRCKRQ